MMEYITPKRIKILAIILCMILVISLVCCSREDAPAEDPLVCTVVYDNLDVHKKASADSKVLGQLPQGLEVEILEQKVADDLTWGYIDALTLPDGTKIKAGWIDLEYVALPGDPIPGQEDPTEEPTTNVEPEPDPVVVNMGTITAGELNIREEPGSKYDSVGTYHNGDRIEILETKTVDDTLWGRTNQGWVGMGYVRMDGTTLPENDAVTSDGNTTVLGYGVVDLGKLNVRLGPGTDYAKVRTVTSGTRYAYYQQEEGWVRIEDGWVSTDYFYIEGTHADDAITGTITAEDLNVRTGPDTSFKSNGSYKQGETVEIYAQVAAWGYTEKGWIFMTYVEPVEPTYTTGTGTVTSGLNIRSEPNADSESVGTYKEGDIVTIIEVQGNWGKTDKGWINLKYVSNG